MSDSKKIGLVLSGGGVRGAAHVGVFKALEDNGIQPTHLSGSSAGAIAAALYAAGYGWEDMLDFFKKNANIFRWRRFSFRKPGILDSDEYQEMFEPWLGKHNFSSLDRTLFVCVTNVLKGCYEFYSSGDLVQPILASAAIPGIFTPVEIGEDWYVDGGVMNNFPIEPLEKKCDLILGSFISPKSPVKKSDLSSTLKIINRATDLSFLAESFCKFSSCDFLFSPPKLSTYGTFDYKKTEEIYEIGYEYASEKIVDLLKMIKEQNW